MATIPEFRPTRCTRYRYRYSECRRCADACPHDAVKLADDGIVLDDARCQNCALCASACRTEALLAGNLPRIDLLKRVAGHGTVSFGCAPSGVGGDEVVPCLGALDPALLSYLATHRIAVELAGSEHCAQCQHAPQGRDQLELNLAGLDLLRQATGDGEWAKTRLAQPKEEHPRNSAQHNASRRQLFRRFVGRGVDRMVKAGTDLPAPPAPQKAIRIAAPFSTVQRELLQTLWQAGIERQSNLGVHPALPLAQLQLNGGCMACEACARVCPTGALQVAEGSRAWSLVFQASRCVACEVCLEACQPGALRLLDAIGLSALVETKPIEMHALLKRRCSRCDRFFVSAEGSETCPVCDGDDADFASIFG